MTISTNYGDLLKRQAWLQQAGAAHLSECTPDQVRVALLAEIGELAQELKPEWAWWRKKNDSKQVDRDKALGEAADTLHFALLFDLVVMHRSPDGSWGEMGEWATWDTNPPALPTMLDDLRREMGTVAGGWGITCTLCSIVARYGFTPHDLARAYWEKTEVNLQRWAAAQ